MFIRSAGCFAAKTVNRFRCFRNHRRTEPLRGFKSLLTHSRCQIVDGGRLPRSRKRAPIGSLTIALARLFWLGDCCYIPKVQALRCVAVLKGKLRTRLPAFYYEGLFFTPVMKCATLERQTGRRDEQQGRRNRRLLRDVQ